MEKTLVAPRPGSKLRETASASSATTNWAVADLRIWLPSSRRSPLEWALPKRLAAPLAAFQNQLRACLAAAGRPSDRRPETRQAWAQSWMEQVNDRPADALLALEALGWCHALHAVVGRLPAALTARLVQALTGIVDRPPVDGAWATSLDRQLLHGELPLMLAAACPRAPQRSVWLALATDCLATGLLETIDPEGMPRAELLDQIRMLLASWTRSLTVIDRARLAGRDDNVREHYSQLVEQMLRLCRPDGRQVLSSLDGNDRCPEMFQAAVELAGDDAKRVAELTIGRQTSHTARRTRVMPVPSEYSESARLAVLRSDWDAKAAQWAIAFPDSHVFCELNCRRETLWSGPWHAEVSVAGQVARPVGEWEEICWVSDDLVDYLELSQPLEGGWRLHRQMLLVRRGRLVYLADAISGSRAADLSYSGRIPLAGGVTYEPATETWEANLVGRRRQGVVVPLFLPEWRSASANGSLSLVDTHLTWTATHRGRSLYAPVLIGLDGPLLKRPMTWRRLTVAENLTIVPPDVAVGFRLQFGRDHWLIYRSLTGVRNRTLLGQNILCNFLTARFTSKGTIETLVETK